MKRIIAMDRLNSVEERLNELEEKIGELEQSAHILDEKLSDVEGAWSALLVEFGARVRELVEEQVDCSMDEIEYRILKKLVHGDIFELKMRDKRSRGEK